MLVKPGDIMVCAHEFDVARSGRSFMTPFKVGTKVTVIEPLGAEFFLGSVEKNKTDICVFCAGLFRPFEANLDIVEQLRDVCWDSESGDTIYPEECEEAAKEIMRLRTDLNEAELRISRLRAELATERAKNEGGFR